MIEIDGSSLRKQREDEEHGKWGQMVEPLSPETTPQIDRERGEDEMRLDGDYSNLFSRKNQPKSCPI